jgi:hypothetical protein
MQAAQLSKSPVPAFQLSLRVRHPSMDPDAISRELKIEPEYSFCAGQPRKAKTNVAASSVGDRHFVFRLSGAGTRPEEIENGHYGKPGLGIFHDCHEVAAHALALLYRIRNEGGQAGLLVALSPAAVGSFSLGAETVAAFGNLGIALEFELAGD